MNHCEFEGRLSGDPVERQLPSGDIIAMFRIVVPRPDGGRVDAIDCAVTNARLRRTLARLEAGASVLVAGQLHRRFWRGPAGVASRYEVEVATLKRAR